MGRKDQEQREDLRRLDALESLVEAHTRTERHLEQHSDIASKEQIEHAKGIQKKREEQIDNLENILATGQHNNEYDE
jgi:hypothetical protein